jgi:hypothetical protein
MIEDWECQLDVRDTVWSIADMISGLRKCHGREECLKLPSVKDRIEYLEKGYLRSGWKSGKSTELRFPVSVTSNKCQADDSQTTRAQAPLWLDWLPRSLIQGNYPFVATSCRFGESGILQGYWRACLVNACWWWTWLQYISINFLVIL